MKILHTESSGGWGGQEIRILTESQVFAERGHEVIIAADKNSQIAKKAFEFGIQVRPITLGKKRWKDFKALRLLIIKENPDLISCHSSTDHWLAAIARLTIKNFPSIVRTRHISTAVHRNWPTKWLYSKGSEAIMTTGTSIRDGLIAGRFVDSSKVFSIPTGIDLNRFTPGNLKQQRKKLGLPENHFIFGIVATLRSWKGHADLIEAFNKLEQSDVSLIIVGDGPQMETCRAMASKTKYPKNIYFFGNQNDVVPYLQAIDSFVLPSYANEGVPQALLQAMAVGVPVITCAIGGIPESIKNYANKTVVATRNPNLLSLSMKEAISQKDEGRVRRRPLTEHSLDRMYESVLEVYKSAIQKSTCS